MTQTNWMEPLEVLRDFRSSTEMNIAAGSEPAELFENPRDVRNVEDVLRNLELILDQMALDPKVEADWEACFDEVTAYRSWFTPLVQRAGLSNSLN